MGYETSKSTMLLIKEIKTNSKERIFKKLFSFLSIFPITMFIILSIAMIFIVLGYVRGSLSATQQASLVHLPLVFFLSINFLFLGIDIWRKSYHFFCDQHNKINFSSVSTRFSVLILLNIVLLPNVSFSSLTWEYLTVFLAFLYVNFGELILNPTITMILAPFDFFGCTFQSPKDDIAKHVLLLTTLSVAITLPEAVQDALSITETQGMINPVGNTTFAVALLGTTLVAFKQVLETGKFNAKALAALTALGLMLSRSSKILATLMLRPVWGSACLITIGLVLHISVNWDKFGKSPAALIVQTILVDCRKNYTSTLQRLFPKRSLYIAINLFVMASLIYAIMFLTQSLEGSTSLNSIYYSFYFYILLALLSINILSTSARKIDHVSFGTLFFATFFFTLYYLHLDLPIVTVHLLFGCSVICIYIPQLFRIHRYFCKKRDT